MTTQLLKKLKQLLSWLLIIATILCFTGCSNESDDVSNDFDLSIEETTVSNTSVDDVLERIKVPKSSVECEGALYDELVQSFTDAGFTNVKTVPNEIEYTDEFENGSVVAVSIDDEPIFESGAEFGAGATIVIQYRVIIPTTEEESTTKPVSATKSSSDSKSPTKKSSSNSNSSSKKRQPNQQLNQNRSPNIIMMIITAIWCGFPLMAERSITAIQTVQI